MDRPGRSFLSRRFLLSHYLQRFLRLLAGQEYGLANVGLLEDYLVGKRRVDHIHLPTFRHPDNSFIKGIFIDVSVLDYVQHA